jgi:hypothetical protein
MRSPQERNTRLENMCWRIWNLARKKKEVIFFVIILVFDQLGNEKLVQVHSVVACAMIK